MANLRIDIAGEFSGRRAFTDASKATSGLEKQVDRLGKKLISAFSAYKIAQFSKASVKAFAEDQKAAAVLARTLENVNQGYQTEMVSAYIAKTEALYGVLDDKLRPAFAQLVVATGDAAKSQQLLQTVLDVSAGTGRDLQTVTAALSKAYLGNTTALARLGAGLSTASLKGKSFNDILTILNQNFAGQAATAADSYQGKLDKLNVAFKNMQETIGKGIIDAFGKLNSDAGFNGVLDKISSLSQDIGDIILGLGVVAGKLQSIPGAGAVKGLASLSFNTGLLGILKNLGAKERVSQSQPMVVKNFLGDMQKIAAATAKQNTNLKTQLSTSKALTKEQKDQLALKKASLELDKALGIFNMEKIELAAAAMSKQSAEDYARIKLKSDILDLQDAINRGDAAAATQLASLVEEDYKRVGAYQAINIAAGLASGLISNVAAATKLIPEDISVINLDNLKDALDYIKDLLAELAKLPSAKTAAGNTSKNGVKTLPPLVNNDGSLTPRGEKVLPPVTDTPLETYLKDLADAKKIMAQNASALKPIVDSGFFDLYYNAQEFTGTPINPYQLNEAQAKALNASQNVTITVNNNTGGLADVIMDTTQQQSANGISTRIIRNTGNLAW